MAWLQGLRDTMTLETHPARGALFETWVVSQPVKQRFKACQAAGLYFWHDNIDHEVDVMQETPHGLQPVEIKPGAAFVLDWLKVIQKWLGFAGSEFLTTLIIYGGVGHYARQSCDVLGWREFVEVMP